MASSRALCTLGLARLISSASSTWAKTGPGESETAAGGDQRSQPQQVGRQQIGGELHPPAVEPQHLRQGMGQGGLAHAGQILDQQVAAGQQGHQRYLELQRLAEDHLLQCRQQPGYLWLYLHVRLPV
jgi:hypothetical protein